ncbi:DUF1801 domain-containing protein, partial [bacterium]
MGREHNPPIPLGKSVVPIALLTLADHAASPAATDWEIVPELVNEGRRRYVHQRQERIVKKTSPGKPEAGKPTLLSGGNPQIAKGYGDAPVQAYIAAIPGWKQEIGRRIDALVAATIPGVSKAVKWNSPFYGVEQGCWFLCFHCFDKYVKVTFFRGLSLDPVPPGPSKSQDTRYLDIREAGFDEAQFIDWVKQASV